jgi:hypothetical protein
MTRREIGAPPAQSEVTVGAAEIDAVSFNACSLRLVTSVGAGQAYRKVYLSWLSRRGQSPPLNYPVDGHDVTGVIDPVDVGRSAARV